MLVDFSIGRKCCVANETSQRMNLESSRFDFESQKRIFEIIGDAFFVTMDRHVRREEYLHKSSRRIFLRRIICFISLMLLIHVLQHEWAQRKLCQRQLRRKYCIHFDQYARREQHPIATTFLHHRIHGNHSLSFIHTFSSNLLLFLRPVSWFRK